jgi:hypothetical protein
MLNDESDVRLNFVETPLILSGVLLFSHFIYRIC